LAEPEEQIPLGVLVRFGPIVDDEWRVARQVLQAFVSEAVVGFEQNAS
jgi:hypothetical protein